ncbi:MAG: hypothetical protein JKX95_09105 [Bacteroidia bacterium]|nr:hypothetical protein [Bacteroidia bacterium]
MKETLLTMIVVIAVIITVNGQVYEKREEANTEKIPLKDRFYTGGDLGLLFGNLTYINISPLLGFKASKRYSIGIGINFEYVRIAKQDISTSIYGVRIFNQYLIIENLFAHIEYAMLNLEVQTGAYESERRWFGLPLIGGGMRQELFGNSFLDLLILYNLNDSYLLPYPNPIIRVSVNVGL